MARPANKLKYTPDMCQRVVELGQTGATQMVIFSDLGISSKTAKSYREKYPEFDEAMDRALVESQAFFEREGLANLNNRNYNTRLFEVITRAQFPHDYRERMEIKQEVKQTVSVDFNSAVNDLLKQLKENAE
jgi:hypothetical protein